MKKKELKAILFDFDGVLSKGRFYSTISDKDQKIKDAIVQNIFSKEAWDVVQTWMRGEKSFEEIHEMFAEKIGTDVDFLNKSLIESILAMKLNDELLNFAKYMRSQGVKVAIFTDNMDIFDRVLVPYNNLKNKFDFVFSSSEYKKLKLDNEAEFLKQVMEEMGVKPAQTLFLDDSPKIGVFMEKFGGHFYLYEDYYNGFNKFIQWLHNTFTIDNE